MWRKQIISGALIFFLIVVILLAWQWKSYRMSAGNPDEENPTRGARLKIEIEQSDTALLVKQTWENINNKVYSIKLPKWGTSYAIETGGKSETIGNNSLEVDENGITISYRIPLSPESPSLWLEDWTVELEGLEDLPVELGISQKRDRTGSWAAGGKRTMDEQMDFVHYTTFELTDGPSALYWIPGELPYREFDRFAIFGNDSFSADGLLVPELSTPGKTCIPNIVFSSNGDAKTGRGLLVLPRDTDPRTIDQRWLEAALRDTWMIGDHDTGLAGLIASLGTGIAPGESPYDNMYQEITSQLRGEEIKDFVRKALSASVSGRKDLDLLLGAVKGLDTDFFQKGGKGPLLFFEEKPVSILGRQIGDTKIFIIGKSRYYPLEKLMNSLGYECERISSDEIYIHNGRDSIRFYSGKDIFIYNEEKYGVFSEDREPAVRILDGNFFVSEDFLIRLFHLQVSEYEDRIVFL
jgi:hypothetical protein